jgi:hypothetical protein
MLGHFLLMSAQIRIFGQNLYAMSEIYGKNMMKKLVGMCLVAGLLLGVSACEGPQGPVGPAGQNGTQGPAGPQGPVGPTGSANVIYSSWTKSTNWGGWQPANVFGVNRSFFDINAPALSQEVLDRGVVLVYTKLTTDNNQMRQLPVTVYAQFTEELLDFSVVLNRIRIWSTPIRPPVPPSPNYEFRYVLIPGGQAARVSYEKLTYEEAKERFNLPD